MRILSLIAIALLALRPAAFAAEPLFRASFEATAVGGEPEGFMIIDGQFAVREFEGGKVFELPGAPLETFGFLFGPTFGFNDAGTKFKVGAKSGDAIELEGGIVTARAQGAKQGRRFPAFAIGMCGVSGYKLRVAPSKQMLELVRGDETVASVGYEWPSGVWIWLKLQVRAEGGQWIAEGKVWPDGKSEPTAWLVTHAITEKPNPGKASAWAAPFSGQPIRFDDLVVAAIEK